MTTGYIDIWHVSSKHLSVHQATTSLVVGPGQCWEAVDFAWHRGFCAGQPRQESVGQGPCHPASLAGKGLVKMEALEMVSYAAKVWLKFFPWKTKEKPAGADRHNIVSQDRVILFAALELSVQESDQWSVKRCKVTNLCDKQLHALELWSWQTNLVIEYDRRRENHQISINDQCKHTDNNQYDVWSMIIQHHLMSSKNTLTWIKMIYIYIHTYDICI